MNRKTLAYCLLTLFLLSCKDREDELFIEPSSYSTFIYMIADNDLDYFAISNIKQLEQNLPEDAKGEIYVYIDRNKQSTPSHAYLLELQRDTLSKRVTSKIIYSYAEPNSSDPANLRSVLEQVEGLCRKNKSLLNKIILWSHGTGWLPHGALINKLTEIPETKSFGRDDDLGKNAQALPPEMDILALKKAFTNKKYDLLILDACFMGSIEVLYELKDHFNYIIASPSEILAKGFPYHKIAKFLNTRETSYSDFAREFYNYYQSQRGVFQTASVSVIQTKYLAQLAAEVKSIGASMENRALDLESVMRYEINNMNWFYDMKSYIDLMPANSKFADIWSNAVVEYRKTDRLFNQTSLTSSHGVSIYIPTAHDRRAEIHQYYKKLTWYKDAGFDLLYHF